MAKKKKKKSITGYMDATDYWHELGEASGGNVVYATQADLLKHQPCAKNCGIVEIETHYAKLVSLPSYQLGANYTLSDYETVAGRRKLIKGHLLVAKRHQRALEKKLRQAKARIAALEKKLT